METEYIVQTSLGFLTTSGGFSAEYPDAEVFSSRKKALQALTKHEVFFQSGHTRLIKDYGLETEEAEAI